MITTQEHNRHTEQCTDCGATPHEGHDDDCRGHLGTGIRNHRAARRYLRNKFRQSILQPVVSRPGARFYVTARLGRRTAWLAGPYISHMSALYNVPRVRRELFDRYPGYAEWMSVGTASRLDTPTPGKRDPWGELADMLGMAG